jgi:hypothetical protein
VLPVDGNACVIAGPAKRNRREPQLVAVAQDGDKPVFAPVGFADSWPVFSGQLNRRLGFLRERLQRRLERLQIFADCLVVCLFLQVLRRSLLRLLRLRIPEALRSTHIHDNSPLSLSLPVQVSLTLRARHSQRSHVAIGKK